MEKPILAGSLLLFFNRVGKLKPGAIPDCGDHLYCSYAPAQKWYGTASSKSRLGTAAYRQSGCCSGPRSWAADYDVRGKRDTVWTLPNDYFVLNQSPKTRMLNVAGTAKIMLVANGSSKLKPPSVSQLQKSFQGKLFRLTINRETVAKIEEVYLPK